MTASPIGIALDAAGHLYVVNGGHIDMLEAHGNVTFLAGDGNLGYLDGPGRTAEFDTANGIAIDSAGNLFVSDILNNAIREISPGDLTPPSASVSVDKAQLWPPNGKPVDVTVSGKLSDPVDAPNTLSASYTVTDSEGSAIPAGAISLNPDGSFAFTLPLVAARQGSGSTGRTYTVTVTATDPSGNSSQASVTVTVPHDQGQG